MLGEVDVHRVHADRGGAAQVVERAVARDPVQPRPHVDLALVGEHRVEGGGEDLLQHVLGVLARAEHVAAEGQQARLVARAERLEGGVLAAAGERDQALVGLQAQQRQTGRAGPACCWDVLVRRPPPVLQLLLAALHTVATRRTQYSAVARLVAVYSQGRSHRLDSARARVAESVYAVDLKSTACKGHVGSNPTPGICAPAPA